jgi:Protein of unknown function (DUF1501)
MVRTPTYSPQLSRRQIFQIGAVAVSGFHLAPMLRPVNIFAKEKVKPRGSAECCIFINLSGGPSHVDTFDIKEGPWTPPEFDIRTISPGIRLPYAMFPMLSQKLQDLVFIRSMQAWENEHIRAQYYLQSAHTPSPSRMKEIPSVGSVVAYELQGHRRDTDYLPPFLAMNFTSGAFKVIGEGCLDGKNGPLSVNAAGANFDFVVQEGDVKRFNRRWEILQKFNSLYRDDKFFDDARAYYRGARAMMESPGIRTVLTLNEEERKRYGSTPLGDACVLARNIVRARAGARFIMISHPGWDLHVKAYEKDAQTKLARQLDSAFANLLTDLANSGELQRTFICCLGEFGRTPGELTVNKGRDHHKEAFAGLFAGAGVRGGRVIGATDAIGGRITDPGWHKKRPVYVEDVAATIYSALGIDWTKTITSTPSGRVFEYIEDQSGTDFIFPGEISELFG